MTDSITTDVTPLPYQSGGQAGLDPTSSITENIKRSDLFARRWQVDSWRALFYFNLLRMWLAATFLSIAWLNTFDTTLGKTHPGYFLLAAGCLLLNGILQFLNIALNRTHNDCYSWRHCGNNGIGYVFTNLQNGFCFLSPKQTIRGFYSY